MPGAVQRVTGFTEADARLALIYRRISASFERNNKAWQRVVAPAFRDALKPVRAQMRSLTPKKTGTLARSITTAADTRRRVIAVGWRYTRGADPRYMQQVAVEFGLTKTRRYPAKAPIRTAWRRSGIGHDRIARLMEQRLERFLQEQVR